MFLKFNIKPVLSHSSKRVLLIGSLFFYLYPVSLVGSGVPLWLVSYFLLLVLWVWRPHTVSLDVLPRYTVILLLLLSNYSGLVTLMTGIEDFTFSIQILKVATIYVVTGVLFGLIYVGNYRGLCFDEFLKTFTICTAIQSVFISLSILSVNFRLLLDSLIAVTGNTNYVESFRVRGFSSAGGASLSLIQSVGVLTALYLYRIYGARLYFILAIFVWLPTLAVGRTGFFLGASFLLANFFYPKSKMHVTRQTGMLFVVFISTLVVLFAIAINADREEVEGVYEYTLPWLFEFFVNAQNGNFSTATTSELWGMLEIRAEIRHLIFGIGVFDSGAFGNERSDSGYVKTLYASGIIGVLIFYLLVASNFLRMMKSSTSRSFSVYIFVILIIGLVAEIKEPFLYQNYFGKYIFILVGIFAVSGWGIRKGAYGD